MKEGLQPADMRVATLLGTAFGSVGSAAAFLTTSTRPFPILSSCLPFMSEMVNDLPSAQSVSIVRLTSMRSDELPGLARTGRHKH